RRRQPVRADELQRAGVDRGAAGVGVRREQPERAGAVLGEAARTLDDAVNAEVVAVGVDRPAVGGYRHRADADRGGATVDAQAAAVEGESAGGGAEGVVAGEAEGPPRALPRRGC